MGLSFSVSVPGSPYKVLPPGIHPVTWADVVAKLGFSIRREALLVGLLAALRNLAAAGCQSVYLDGSFVTSKQDPEDYDGAWDERGVNAQALDPVLLDFSNKRAAQKRKYLGELFPSGWPADPQGRTFLSFFQQTRDGYPKGIVHIDLRSLPPAP